MKRSIVRLLCAALAAMLGLCAVGCSVGGNSTVLAGGKPLEQKDGEYTPNDRLSKAYSAFSAELLRGSLSGEKNTLVSPLSVALALAMTANGADGETLSQMEAVLGGIDIAELNEYLCDYVSALPSTDEAKLHIANSLWFRDNESAIAVRDEFLDANSKYYGASVYSSPFDEGTLRDINKWVDDNTDGMIDRIIDKIPVQAVMYIINALAFDAKWMKPYDEYSVHEGTFHAQNGSEQSVDFMNSNEYSYIEDKYAEGFIKRYEGERYAFAALLPKDDKMSLEDYISRLDGDKLYKTFTDIENVKIITSTPKFEFDYGLSLVETLAAMGMTDAFDPALADLSGIGESDIGELYIGDVIHKTYISVDELGTKAGAVTAMTVEATSAPNAPEPKIITLDRPFLFAITDMQTGMPLFIGTVLSV